ncbi:hypothetical protein [Mesonia aestuariivivens]|uniref:Uncharacterized protein n=1 Tax=Mesonia aestuariivivens TaxID=2796128 RepID=A0ABS6W0A4_9FLAO|nr:hypothetical protein [Mesonia aestuariivivens]MBW2961276.1 hypothetical protein [Mesonia aestuariivivens]
MIKDILNGWKNYLIENPVIEEVAKERSKICATSGPNGNKCTHLSKGKFTSMLRDYKLHEIEGYYCSKCKCPLSAKVRSKNEKCPINKW